MNDACDDLRQYRNDRLNDRRKVCDEGGQERHAGFDDLRDSFKQRRNQAFNQFRQSLQQYGNRFNDALRKPCDKLQRRFNKQRNVVNQGLHKLRDGFHRRRNQRRQRFPDALNERRDHLRRRFGQLWQGFQQALHQRRQNSYRALDKRRRGVCKPGYNVDDDLRAEIKQFRQLVGRLFNQFVDRIRKGFFRAVSALQEIRKSVYEVSNRGHEFRRQFRFYVGNRAAEPRKRIVEFRLRFARRHDRSVIFLENIGRVLILRGQRFRNQGGTLCFVPARGKFFIEFVLGNADPVQRIGKRARNLSNLRRFVGGFNQAVNRQRVAKRTLNACGNVRPRRNVLFRRCQLCQKLRGFRCVVRVAQHGIEGLVCRACRIRRKPGGLKRRIQLSLCNAVFFRGFAQIKQKFYPGDRRRADSGKRRARRFCTGDKPAFQFV